MVDNTRLNSGSGGDLISTDEVDLITGLKVQNVKVQFGPGGEADFVTPNRGLPVTYSDSASLDAFGRLRVSEPTTIFDSKLLSADDAPLFWDESLESGAGITATTPTAAKPYIDMVSTVSTAGKFTRQTFRRFNYQPGKSQLVAITGVLTLDTSGTGVERRIGLFDDDNGFYFEDANGVITVNVRTNDSGSPVETSVTRSSWNIDTMDGDDDLGNPSGILVDWSKAQIFVIDYQWLGAGRVRFGLDIGGTLYYVHEVNNANTLAIPTTSTPNLPIRYQMITTASSPAVTLRAICSTVISEGGLDPVGLTHNHATTDHVNANTADTVYALVGIRLKAGQVGCTVDPVSVSVLTETADAFEWQVIFNPTVAGTFTYSDKTNSCCQTATGDTANPSTNTVTGGTVLWSGFGSTSSAVALELENSLTLGVAIDGTLDELVLAVRPLGINSDVQGALNWRELF